ncbi:MAG: nitroreductase family protein [Anaeromicrobium sp.]|jgi:nitroreductase|uniref:nitroreductase family protein n=1 Tax=Anaeromicrobium sp. TaxID=1929132 RepID=UPI0025F8A34C|nr:nitroreductase family protein [Anaeromicrobium sp.]MCT4594990.1 nitroreductase family protein [Anaeromicrobium sp.]
MNEVIKTIKKRRMTGKFKNSQLTDEQIIEIINAGQHAPSVQKQQAWNFTVIQDRELLNELSKESKLIGQKSDAEVIRKLNSKEDYHVFYNAPTVIIVSADKEAMMPEAECIAATQNMLLAAESMNIGACWISALEGLFNSHKGDEYRKKLNLGDNQIPQLAISLGHIESRPEKAYPRRNGKYKFIR